MADDAVVDADAVVAVDVDADVDVALAAAAVEATTTSEAEAAEAAVDVVLPIIISVATRRLVSSRDLDLVDSPHGREVLHFQCWKSSGELVFPSSLFFSAFSCEVCGGNASFRAYGL